MTLALALLAWAGGGAPLDAQQAAAGHWEGELTIPTGAMQIMVDLKVDGSDWSGTIDIPMQMAMDLPLNGVKVTADSVWFAIADVPGEPKFVGTWTPERMEGSFLQSGMSFGFWLGREALPGPPRPQTPLPPFPYTAEEVTYEGSGVTLAGTLTVPPGGGPHPAVLLITGSGAQDRDETIFEHKPFLVLADHLTRAGIAVLRVDDRGVGGSEAAEEAATSEDLAEDVAAGVAYLAGRDRIDADRIGLIGHSEGGLIAPMAATRSDRVAFIVLLSGPGVNGLEILLEQTAVISRASFRTAGFVARQRLIQRRLLEAIVADRPTEEIRSAMEELVAHQAAQLADEQRARIVDQQMASVTSPWFRFFLAHDPVPVLRQVRVPVLALFGEKDLQVVPGQNMEPLRTALEEGGNGDVTVIEVPGVNHLFQPATSGLVQEYGRIETTVDPAVLDQITDWILERFGRP